MFALKTQSQLVEGDSGSIVYLNPPDGILRPIAMYVQKIVLSSPNRSNDPKNPFQAHITKRSFFTMHLET
ncbi:hypothetical protein EB796_015681 [Bugula neritina]|uniref:Uncharacterized protein n=1 Tax=Bugula neritina TaxID=10212 RepID=A0A7J7JK64_BUGNE|nr:hypothetical protein EB796_015681 [Bugula neritina]